MNAKKFWGAIAGCVLLHCLCVTAPGQITIQFDELTGDVDPEDLNFRNQNLIGGTVIGQTNLNGTANTVMKFGPTLVPAPIPNGLEGYVLTIVGGVPAYAVPTGGGGGGGSVYLGGSQILNPNFTNDVAIQGGIFLILVNGTNIVGYATNIFNAQLAANAAIALTKLQNITGLSVLGNPGNAGGVPQEIAAGLDGQVFRRNGSALGFGQVNLSSANGITGTLPLANGGSGQSTPSAAADAFQQTAEASVASAATTDLGAAGSQNVLITGTTTITSFGTVAAGTKRFGRFNGVLTLTHNGTSLILPNAGSNITTAAGDGFIAVSLGSGNWRVYCYQRADGTALVGGVGGGDFSSNTASSVDGEMMLFAGTGGKTGKRATGSGLVKLTSGVQGFGTPGTDYYAPGSTDVAIADGGSGSSTANGALDNFNGNGEVSVASAATTDLGAQTSQKVSITGTTTITSFGTVTVGVVREGRFTGILTLTHNGSSLILPGGVNITTAAGDRFRAYSLGSGNWVVMNYTKADGTPVVASDYKPGGTDVAIADGGSGSSTANGALDNFTANGEVSVASAATTDLGAQTSQKVSITGTTTITSFGTVSAGITREGRFTGILTLTHNASSLILPGGANITTAAGDRFRAYSLGSGNWVVVNYVRASGLPILEGDYKPGGTDVAIADGGSGSSTANGALDNFMGVAEASVASAATTDLGAQTSRKVAVTGTTTITSFGTVAAGTERIVRFSGALTLTHNGTSLILPGGANITTAAGDTAYCVSLGSGNWRVYFYHRASGAALVGGGGTFPGSATDNGVVRFDGTGGSTVQNSGVTISDTDDLNVPGNIFANSIQTTNGVFNIGGGVVEILNGFALSGDLTPSQVTANQNDYGPAGLTTNTVLRVSTDASRNFTGLVGQEKGRLIAWFNVGSFAEVLTDADAASVATNRFLFGANITLQPNQGILLRYDVTLTRWVAWDGMIDASRITTGTLPVARGGTGQTTGNTALDSFNQNGEASVASAATTDLGAQTSQKVSITGTTTITSFGTVAAGTRREGRFTGILTLTHNASSLILPGGANITTAAGDRFQAYSLGSGNWVVLNYVKASGLPILEGDYKPGGTDVAIADGGTGQSTANAGLDALGQTAEASLASATTTDLGAQTSQNVQVTGTTTITSFGTVAAGTRRWVRFSGILTLTHNATSLILPNNGSNITTAAGDRLLAVSLGGGNWLVYVYQKADGTALVGGAGGGDFSSNTSTSVDSEFVVFSGTAGKTGKRFTGTGVVHATSGVGSVGTVTVAEGGTGQTTANAGQDVLQQNTEASVASAATTDLGAQTSQKISITGTTTITSFGTVAAGTRREGRFTGALTLTHNASSLILPGNANITTAAGDRFQAYSLGSGNWVVISYVKADGTPIVNPTGMVSTTSTIVKSSFVPVGWMEDGSTAPDAIQTYADTRKIDIRKFSNSADNILEFGWQIPVDATDGNGGTGDFQLKWRAIYIITEATAPAANEGVTFGLAGASVADDEDFGATVGTEVDSSTANLNGHAQGDIAFGPYVEMTVTGGAAGEMGTFSLRRDTADTNDDYAQKVGLIGVEFKYVAILNASY